MADDFSAFTDTTGTIAVGGSAGGTIEAGFDRDWFRATLTGGQTYVVKLRGFTSGAGTLTDPYLRGIHDANGFLLADTLNDDHEDSLDSQVLFTPITSGTYFIAAGAYGPDIGSYLMELAVNGPADDHLAGTGTGGAVAVGGSATGTIETALDHDWFQVSLVGGQPYVIDLRGAATGHGTLADPYLYGLHDAAGAPILGTTNDDANSLNSQVRFTAPATGSYFIAAGAYGGDTGTYTLSVATDGPADDFAASGASTGAVAVDGSATGSIEEAGDEDWFGVALAAGHRYRIDVTGLGSGDGTLQDPYLAGLYSAGGAYFAGTTDDDGGEGLESRVEFVPATAGTYFVAAAAFGDGTGSYRVAVADLGLADDFAAGTATAGSVAVDGTASGRIETGGDEDWFAVGLEAGAQYQIDVIGAGDPALADPYLRGVHGAAGALIPGTTDDDGGDGLNSQVVYTATATGVHYISAGAFGDLTGGYQVVVTRLSQGDDFADSTATTGSVAVDGSGHGNIETEGDRDWFAVALAGGSEYRFDVIGADDAGGTLADAFLHGIRTADGTLLAGTTDDDGGEGLSSRASLVAPATGTYYIDVGGYGIATGTYTVAVSLVAAPVDDFAASTATTGTAALGVVASGTVEAAGDEDWFALSLTAGHTYRIDLMGATSHSGTLADPFLRGLYDAAGVAIAGTSNDDGGDGLDSRLEFTASTSATYFAAAGGFGDGTGSYKLLVQDLGAGDDFSADTGTAGTVAVDGTSAGAIESGGDQDWFAVALTAGARYRIDLRGAPSGNGSLADPYLAGLFDAAGVAVPGTSDDDGGTGLDSQLTFTAAATGTHYVAASGFGGTTGSYKLAVTALDAAPPADDFSAGVDTAGTVAVDGSRSGSIEVASDQDWFAVTLVGGQTYDIGIEGAATNGGTLEDPFLRGLYTATGTPVNGTAADDGGTGLNSLHRFTAPASGVYFVAAGGAGPGTGSYKVTVTQVAGAPPPPPADTGFNITITFTGNEAYRSYFDAAVLTWQSVITGDLPDVTDPTHGFVDDLRIDAAVVAIDGPGSILGQAGPRAFRDGSSLPYLGMMQFDEADLAGMVAKGILQDVIEHEMGHVLGMSFGMWSFLGLASDTSFTGANALREYRTLTGGAEAAVPLEAGGGAGTRQSHWAENVFDTELMTGFAEQAPPMPLSRVTIGALQDMGYTVSYDAAEAYALPGTPGLVAGAAASQAGGGVEPGLSALGEEPGTPPITGNPDVAAAAGSGFGGARVAFFEDKPVTATPNAAAVKLDGTVTSASATTVMFYESTTGNGYLVELIGTFERNDPATASAVKGMLTEMRLHSAAGLVASYDFGASPRDVATVLDNHVGIAFGGDTLVESRAPGAQDDRLETGGGNDILAGALGNDSFRPGAGNDRVFGGAGTDTAEFAGARGDYRIGVAGTVVRLAGTDGEDWLEEVEQLQFGATAPITLQDLLADPTIDELMSFVSAGRTAWVLPEPYSGPLALNYVYNGSEAGDVAAGTTRNDFMNLFNGDDAMNMGAGNDVADGGGGSNFLTGGSGLDVFFTDARGLLTTWSTITDWEAGEQLAVWGWNPGVSTATWSENAGTPGFTGATMFADIDANGAVETVVTWSGRSVAEIEPLKHESPGLLWFY